MDAVRGGLLGSGVRQCCCRGRGVPAPHSAPATLQARCSQPRSQGRRQCPVGVPRGLTPGFQPRSVRCIPRNRDRQPLAFTLPASDSSSRPTPAKGCIPNVPFNTHREAGSPSLFCLSSIPACLSCQPPHTLGNDFHHVLRYSEEKTVPFTCFQSGASQFPWAS